MKTRDPATPAAPWGWALAGALAGLMLVGAIGHGSLRFLSRNKRNKEH